MLLHSVGYFIISLAKIVQLLAEMYVFVIAASVLISWIGADPYNPIVRFVRQMTEPVFSRFRRYVPKALFRTGMDFTPVLVLILLIFIENFVVNVLFELGQSLLMNKKM